MQSRRTITAHRFARLIAWLCAVLLWVARGAPAHRRRTHPAIAKLRKAVACIVLIEAATLVHHHGRCGPRRYGARARSHVPLRAIGGAWLRRQLRIRGTLITQAKHLIAALRTCRALAAALAHRRRRPFTRLAPILASAGLAAPLVAVPLAPAIANSS